MLTRHPEFPVSRAVRPLSDPVRILVLDQPAASSAWWRDTAGGWSGKMHLEPDSLIVTCKLSVKPRSTFRRSSGDLHLPPTLPSRQPAGQGTAFLQLHAELPAPRLKACHPSSESRWRFSRELVRSCTKMEEMRDNADPVDSFVKKTK